ncbi:MAG: ATP-binding cassette domain-containing protein [Lachnospiraceae bacterium]|jgi:Fe-S cluster assembly ATP-binding protein|nr:ATP-binding cassette domain-containing protein [Lachnospiraceae bacterium]
MLELKDLCFIVEEDNQKKTIIDHMNLKIDQGKFVVITGPNGGGKSTLAKLIMGIKTPTSGQILYNGTNITNMSITERAKLGISFAFQQPVHFKGITVLDLLRLSAGKQLSISEACEFLSQVGMCAKEYINREVNASLSGGELKRIEIATVLARGTEVSIFDEPEAGIDLWSFQHLTSVFENIRTSAKGTVLIISHQERILAIADEIVMIKDGKVEAHKAKDEIFPKIVGTSQALSSCGMLSKEDKKC